MSRASCLYRGCDNKHFARGLCKRHFHERTPPERVPGVCVVPWCEEPAERYHFCAPHHQELHRPLPRKTHYRDRRIPSAPFAAFIRRVTVDHTFEEVAVAGGVSIHSLRHFACERHRQWVTWDYVDKVVCNLGHHPTELYEDWYTLAPDEEMV